MTEPTLRAAPRWVHNGPYGGRRYNWAQCRFCGRAGNECAPVACLLCATVQCNSRSECAICLHGWLPGWWRGTSDDGLCGRKGCDQPAVARAPRVMRVCLEHAATTKLRMAGRTVALPEYVAERIAHRDLGAGWERWRLLLPDGTLAVSQAGQQ